MRIIVTGDTHGAHRELGAVTGDLLIHCGDFENLFEPDAGVLADVDDWFGSHQVEHVVCIGGNHDRALQERSRSRGQPFKNATYLRDDGFEWRGVKIHGSPWVPQLRGHAYYADEEWLEQAWANIPGDVDVLITHTPPAGTLDVSSSGRSHGCPLLADRMTDISPSLHCFGHVHASAGVAQKGRTTHVNASAVKGNYQIATAPFVFDRDDTGGWRQA